jgi:cytochrome P450
MVGICIITLIAGHDTTANTMAMGVAALSTHPEARETIRTAPQEDVETAVLEIMRYIAMSTMMPRIVAEDFTWRGHELKKGQFVFLMIAGANRDAKVFPDPDKLDLSREQFPNMTFAPGLHHCIGHLLAKMQLGEFFPEFLRRFDAEVLDDHLNFGHAMSFRGLESLHLRLTPRT